MGKLNLLIVVLLSNCIFACSGEMSTVSNSNSVLNEPPIVVPPVTPPTTTGNLFSANVAWNQDISTKALDSQSSTIINWLNSNGGWGTGSMRVDFSFHVLTKIATTPNVPVTKKSGYYSPACDNNTTFPLPVGGAIEGYDDYSCPGGGDCHILVVDQASRKLYESYSSAVSGGRLNTLCIAEWDLDKNYSDKLRGEQCTSTDAAGLPIAPLLFTADEIAAGEITHAIRFILPNPRMRAGVYVRPATHAGGPSGPANAVPYGARFRLKNSVNISGLKPAAQVVAKAMKKYGMILADGGNIALTAASDKYTATKWSDVDFGPGDLSGLRVTDFEMVEAGERITLTYDCVREP